MTTYFLLWSCKVCREEPQKTSTMAVMATDAAIQSVLHPMTTWIHTFTITTLTAPTQASHKSQTPLNGTIISSLLTFEHTAHSSLLHHLSPPWCHHVSWRNFHTSPPKTPSVAYCHHKLKVNQQHTAQLALVLIGYAPFPLQLDVARRQGTAILKN